MTKAGAKLDGEAVRPCVLKASRRAGVEKKVSPHALRRACATQMIRRSANPWHVKELLGHEDFRSLDVYAKLTILDLEAAHRRHHPREQGSASTPPPSGAEQGLCLQRSCCTLVEGRRGDMYRIVYYRTDRGDSPVEEFIEGMSEKHQRKIAGFLELLAEEGPRLRRPYADQVRGSLRELRIQFGRNEYRVLHFFVAEERVVLLHAFAKKTQKLPEQEIETAEGRMKEFLKRLAGGGLVP